jgi:GTPase SAR1 family protein
MTFGIHNYFAYKPQSIALNNPLLIDPKVIIDTSTQPEDGSSMLLQKFVIHLQVYTVSRLKTSYCDEMVVHLIQFVLFVSTQTIGAAFAAKEAESNGKKFMMGIWDTAGSER